MNTGKIVQVIGPVVDVQFAEHAIPPIYQALTIEFTVSDKKEFLTLEIQQHLGGGVAREVIRRGGRVVAVSTLAGYIADPAGLDVEVLLALRRVHGDACISRYGRLSGPPGELFTAVSADVVVPGARPGAIGAIRARQLLGDVASLRRRSRRPAPST